MTEEHVVKKVASITFGLLSPKHIKKMAVAKIVTPELYDKEGYPVDGGLMDIRLGVIDPGLRCKTCGGRLKECFGHFGYIEIARPVIHIKYIKIILDLLRSSCRDCGRVLASEEKITSHLALLEKLKKENNSKKMRIAIKDFTNGIKNVKKCPHCQAKQIKIKIEKPSTFLEDNRRINPIQMRARLEKIPDLDLVSLGLNPEAARPEWMVLTVLAIPPVTVRPSITLESGERSEDDLTHKLSDIVRINQRLFENINAGAPEIIIEDLWDLLQYHVTTFFDNNISQIPPARHRSGQPLKTLSQRIKSKEGRFRHNLAGKRVNYSARTVISPDSKIAYNEVGVPLLIAMDLTVPETVSEWNIKWLKEFIKNGPAIYPGANYIVTPDGKKRKITEETQEQILEELEPGYVVERHLINGDVSIFNRQPSLHRMSIMCHKIKVLPGRSFRLNPAVCTPYNADFDGDEMNLHVPQTEEARAEAELLMSVQQHIITPKNGLNVIGNIQDAITGNYLLTKEMEFTKEKAIDILMSIGVYNPTKFKKFGANVSGKEVFSALLPDDFDFIGQTRACKRCDKCLADKCKDHAYVRIKKGVMVSGLIDQATIGEENGSLIRALYAKYDENRGIKLLNDIFKLGIEILLRRGFTTAISDTDLPDKIKSKNKAVIDEAFAKVDDYIKKYKENKLEILPGMTAAETVEARIIEVLNKVRDKVGEAVIGNTSEHNSTMIMATSGGEGNVLNITQMAACVGQQVMRAKRVQNGYKDRTLTIFKRGDISPKAKGFVKDGFKKGLNPSEYFYSAMTGRDALMDTALRTPKSGYLYRRLANALQDLKVEYDYTVRDANHGIIQYEYGEDGLDVSKTDGGIINIKKIIKEVTQK
ncbi:MAG: DNA-directed RNA polymerase subunit A' [Nanoarchaeota archaeon]|nr:DNA-directed RNA polymerase subunit A' [Nanoarchaeota archaeon]